MFAVIRTGGKQYRVAAEDVIKVDKVRGNPGEIVQFGEVLVVGGDSITLGQPTIAGASVAAEVIEQGRGPKIIAFKKRRRKNSRRRRGHRQEFTLLRVTEILTDGAKPSQTARPKREPKKPSPALTHSVKSSSDSHNEPATQEVAVRETEPTPAPTDVPPVAPSLGQLSAASSANLAAAIVATNTPTPGLTLPQSRGVTEGKLIRKVLPQYPEMARRAGVGGDVVLSATIGTDGKLKNIRVVSGSPLLREAAISAARQWRYSPYLLGGKPVETDTHITISFKH